nr:putative ribonuclease H-like domain-containing protein [Tanacetum cinerariifolium]
MSWTGLPEFKDDVVTDYSRPAPTIESSPDDAQNRNTSVTETEASPSAISPKSFIKFVKADDSPNNNKTDKAETAKKPPVKYAEQYRKPTKKPNVRGNQRNWNNLKSHQLGPNFVMKKNACFNCGDFNHLAYDCRKRVKKETSRSHNTTHKSFTPRPAIHNPYRPPMRPVRSNMNECIVLGRNLKLSDDDNVLLRTPRQHNMYLIDLNNIVPHKDLTCLVAKASVDECMLWHRRLGHLNFKTINKLVRHNLVRGLPTKCFENDHTCTACLKGKQHKASCKSKLVSSVSKPLHTLHMDLFGPTSVSSISHKWYCLVVTYDFSMLTWTFFLKAKDETSGILRKFITKIENLKDLKVKIIRCDNRGEFRNKEMNDVCSQKVIKREFINARIPQQNGVAERRNRTLIEAARIMLADAKLPVTFLAEAVNIACNVQNRVLVNKSQNKTPYELFNDLLTKPFDAGRFQYLVCKLFPLLGKLSTVSVFLGFGLTCAGTFKYWGVLKILILSLRLILLSEHNVNFHPIVDFVEASPLRRARIAQSSALPPVADESTSPLRDVSKGEAYPIDSGFEADQDRANIAKSSTLPYDSAPRVTSPAADEGRAGNPQMKGAATERVSDDTEEMETVLTSMDVAIVLSGGVAEVPTGSGSIPTAGPPVAEVPTGSDVLPTAGLIFATATVVTPYTRRKGKETILESETLKKKKVQEQLDIQMARQLEEEMERENQRMSEQIARDAEEYKQFAKDLSIGERVELINDPIKYQENYAQILKYQTQQRKPWSKKQKRDYYMAFIKSNLGWKVKDFRGMTFEEIEAKFTTVWKQIEKFIPMGLKEEAERFKRKGIRFELESVKRLKTSEEVPEEVKSPDEVPEEKVKEMMQLVPIEEVYVEALQVKHLIIDWKVHTEEQRRYWKITRLGGSSASYQFFVDMLKHLDREDLNQLWALVKESLSNRPPTSDKEMEL